jgi:sortase (surface protein transpeptidase)
MAEMVASRYIPPPLEQRTPRIVDRSRLVKPQPIQRPKPTPKYTADILPPAKPQPQAISEPIVSQPPIFTEPAVPKTQKSQVLSRQFQKQPVYKAEAKKRRIFKYSKLQTALLVMAFAVFATGLLVNLQTVQTNQNAKAQVSALSKKADNPAAADVPSTVKPTPAAIYNYVVAPDLPRYITIPKIGVHARVLQIGVKTDGSLDTPHNVYDAAWYTGSAKPGQAGASLIDGHVSSWTAHGVFYSLNKLTSGDVIQIERGDGSIITYKVIKTQTYDADNVDMQQAITPVTPGKPGLNLITCAGKVKSGTSEFNKRLVIFAEQT